jgi:hypothetical protein
LQENQISLLWQGAHCDWIAREIKSEDWGKIISRSSDDQVPGYVKVLDANCFCKCRSLSSIAFESRSRLSQIESEAFLRIHFVEIVLFSSVEVLGVNCFSACRPLPSAYLNQGRDCLDWLGWLFRYRSKSWVRSILLSGDPISASIWIKIKFLANW